MEALTWLTAGAWIGTLLGVLLGLKIASIQRTGRLGASAIEGIAASRTAHLPEAAAQRALVESAIKRGTEEILSKNPKMSRREAAKLAEDLWRQAGDPLGGVQ